MDEPFHGLTLIHFTNEDIMRIKTIGILVIAAAVIGGGGYGLHHYLASSMRRPASRGRFPATGRIWSKNTAMRGFIRSFWDARRPSAMIAV